MATRPNIALDPLADKLRQVHTIPALVQYLHDELGSRVRHQIAV